MNLLENLADGYNYQFPRWSTSSSRPYSSLSTRNVVNDTVKLNIDHHDQLQRPDASPLSTKRVIRHHIRIPTASGLASPPSPNPPSTSPDLIIKSDPPFPKSMSSRRYRSISVRIKSTSLSIPSSKAKDGLSSHNFPRQTHEQRKITHERKRRIQQSQVLADKYAEVDTWFQFKQSLSELKRLTTTQNILNDPNSSSLLNPDEQLLSIVKADPTNEEKKERKTTPDLNRSSLSTPHSSFSHPRPMTTHSRLVFEPLMIASKPIHPVLFTTNHITPRIKPPLHRFRPMTIPSPAMVEIEREILSRKISTPSPTRFRAPSTMQLTSTIKLKTQIQRCHSATDIKSSLSINKHPPLRFILICDQEHRIESWYHQYPFIHSDDLLASFQSKSSPQKSTISAFFIDDSQSSNPNITAKTFLQGKPFHINNDWKKFDMIFISKNIFDEIIIYLQAIIKLSGKVIQIYQINHQEDLKKQVKHICRQLQQPNI